jgi:hypothetical protein
MASEDIRRDELDSVGEGVVADVEAEEARLWQLLSACSDAFIDAGEAARDTAARVRRHVSESLASDRLAAVRERFGPVTATLGSVRRTCIEKVREQLGRVHTTDT